MGFVKISPNGFAPSYESEDGRWVVDYCATGGSEPWRLSCAKVGYPRGFTFHRTLRDAKAAAAARSAPRAPRP